MTRLLLAVVAAVLLAAPAAADPPLRLPGQITDEAGALAGGRAQVQAALDRLYDERRLRLWVVYVERFDTGGWAEATADRSGLGDRDVLLAVATADREYGLFSPGLPSEITDAEFDDVRVEQVEPALRRGDWAGAAVAAADGLGQAAGPRGAGSLWVIIGLAVVGGIAVWWYARRKRAQRTAAGLATARQTDDPAALAALPDDVLDERSRELLVEVDNALRASAEELELARGEFGEARTRPFTTAYEGARTAAATAFAIRQRLDDDVPETPQQRRDLLVELITGLTRADRDLDARVAEFDALRDLLIDAPNRLDALTEQVVAVRVRLPESAAAWARLSAEFPAPAVAPVKDNVAMAEQRVAFAEQSIGEGRAAIARPAGEQGAAVAAIRAAEAAIGQAATLLDAVDHAADTIRESAAALPTALDALRADIAEAERRGGLAEVVAKARAALDADPANPMAAYAAVTAADAELDAATAAAAERQRRADLLDQTTSAAAAQITAAEDFISARRGAIGAQARTRLAEARRHLDAARTADPAAAQQHAQAALDLARRAAAEADTDVRRWESARTPQPGGDLGAMLGGILIGSTLGGRGGSRPASFGGTRGTRRHGGGGRF